MQDRECRLGAHTHQSPTTAHRNQARARHRARARTGLVAKPGTLSQTAIEKTTVERGSPRHPRRGDLKFRKRRTRALRATFIAKMKFPPDISRITPANPPARRINKSPPVRTPEFNPHDSQKIYVQTLHSALWPMYNLYISTPNPQKSTSIATPLATARSATAEATARSCNPTPVPSKSVSSSSLVRPG